MMDLGFACEWDERNRARTWSGTPYRLLRALQDQAEVTIVDVPIAPRRISRSAARTAGIRRRNRHWVTVSSWWSLMSTIRNQALLHSLRRAVPSPRAVLSIGEHGPLPVPQFVYQDMAIQHLLHPDVRTAIHAIPDLPSLAALRRRALDERRTYGALAGIFTMSEWSARFIRTQGGIDESRVHVVGTGLNVPPTQRSISDVDRLWSSPVRLVAFVGRHFFRKGGDLVVEAVRRLRRSGDFDVKMAILGPTSIRGITEYDSWVTLYGDATLETLQDVFQRSHVLALPSRFEAYGIAILEALASGVPVVGRNAFAMPEMIVPGVNGSLINDDEPDELAEALHSMFCNDSIVRSTVAQSADVAARHQWLNVAQRMIEVIGVELERQS